MRHQPPHRSLVNRQGGTEDATNLTARGATSTASPPRSSPRARWDPALPAATERADGSVPDAQAPRSSPDARRSRPHSPGRTANPSTRSAAQPPSIRCDASRSARGGRGVLACVGADGSGVAGTSAATSGREQPRRAGRVAVGGHHPPARAALPRWTAPRCSPRAAGPITSHLGGDVRGAGRHCSRRHARHHGRRRR